MTTWLGIYVGAWQCMGSLVALSVLAVAWYRCDWDEDEA